MSMVAAIESQIVPEQFQAKKLELMVSLASELPDAYVQQLVDKSRQPHILQYEGHEDVGTEETPGRFRNLESYRTWASGKERVFYLMIDDALRPDCGEVPDIGGVIWFGRRQNEHAPERELTFAIRNYAEDQERGWAQYRGLGLGTPFMRAAHQNLRNWHPNEKIWLDLVEGNEPALNLYRKNGYQEVTRIPDEEHEGRRRIVMANDTALMDREAR